MADAGRRRKLALLPGQAEAEIDIDVLVTAEIAPVKAASFEEKRTRIKSRGAIRAEAFSRRGRSRGWMSKAAAPCVAIREIIVPCPVELRGIVEIELER